MVNLSDFFEQGVEKGYKKCDVVNNCHECDQEAQGYYSQKEGLLLLLCKNGHKTKVALKYE